MKHNWKDYLKLFSVTFYLSAFTFGGGYVIIALMRKKFVDELKWIEEEEMLNLAAIAQSTPGAVAVNASILVGFRMAGILGSFVAILGTVLPPLIILSVISFFYQAFKESMIIVMILKGMSAAIAAIIADVVFNMGKEIIQNKIFYTTAVMFLAFLAKIFLDQVVIILLVCGLIGFVIAAIENHQRKAGVKDDPA